MTKYLVYVKNNPNKAKTLLILFSISVFLFYWVKIRLWNNQEQKRNEI